MIVYLAGGGGTKDKAMKLYLAGEHPVKNGTKAVTWKGINILESYWYARKNVHFPRLLQTCENFILDSGAFTFLQKGVVTNWENYTKQYADFVLKHNIKHFFEMDIDSITSLSYVEKLRQILEDKTKLKPIPVWHKNRSTDYFVEMCKNYPYVALGGIVIKEFKWKDYEKIIPWFIKTAHDNNCKIHGLGFTRIKELHRFKFDSVDSKAWVSGNMGGYLYKFMPNGEMKQVKQENARLKSSESALHNFSEWVKFSKYAEIYL